MTAPETGEPDAYDIKTDEDWKQRVKAEDAALDEKLRHEPSPATEMPDSTAKRPRPEKDKDDPSVGEFPPADFATIVGTFTTQAMVSLGLIANPATGAADVQIDLARYFIDLLGVLEEKTKGNLDSREASLLQSSLYQLRMAFIEVQRNAGAKSGARQSA